MIKQIMKIKTTIAAVILTSVLATNSSRAATANDLESIRTELRAIRELLEKHGRQIDTLYRIADAEINIAERLKQVDERKGAREQEEAQDKRLTLERVWETSGSEFTSRAECSPTDRTFVVVAKDGSVRLHDMGGKALQKFRHGEERVKATAYSPDGTRLLAGTAGGKLLLWDLKTGTARVVGERPYQIDRVAWMGKTGRALVCSALGESIKGPEAGEMHDVAGDVFDVESGKSVWKFTGWQHLDYQNLMPAPNGEWVALFKILKERGVVLLDAQSGGISGRLLPDAGDGGLSVAVAPDSQIVAEGTAGTTGVYLWDVKRREVVRHLEGHQNWVVALAFSADGQRLISGAGDSTARVWNVKDGQELGRIRFLGNSTYVHSVGFSPDGKMVLAASDNGQLVIARTVAGGTTSKAP